MNCAYVHKKNMIFNSITIYCRRKLFLIGIFIILIKLFIYINKIFELFLNTLLSSIYNFYFLILINIIFKMFYIFRTIF